MKKMAVVLSGCGFQDGSEITETISTLIALSEHNVEYESFAPNIQFESVNHLTGQSEEPRQILAESARITRGKVQDISKLNHKDFNALIFPGGYGAAIHLSNWAEKGASCQINTYVQNAIKNFYADSKPICAICIAPVLAAKVLGQHGVSLTIGNDTSIASEIEKTEAHHVICKVDDYVTDRENKLITTPAYMFGNASPYEVFSGIRKAIKELVEMA